MKTEETYKKTAKPKKEKKNKEKENTTAMFDVSLA